MSNIWLQYIGSCQVGRSIFIQRCSEYFITSGNRPRQKHRTLTCRLRSWNTLDNSECVYRLSSSVKTSYGVGKIAMTQKRLFLLTTGRCRYVEITKFMDIEVCEFIPVILLLKWEVSVCGNRMNPVNTGSKDLHCFVPAFEDPISKDQEQAKERCIWS